VTDDDLKDLYEFKFEYDFGFVPIWSAVRRNSFRSVYAPGEVFTAFTLSGLKRQIRRYLNNKDRIEEMVRKANEHG
jgi:hypothetical protein